MNRTSERAMDNSSEFAKKISHQQLTASAMEYAISVYLQTGNTDTTISDTAWEGSEIAATISLDGKDTIQFIDTVSITTICEYESISETSYVNLVSRSILIPPINSSVGVYSDSTTFSFSGNVHIYGIDTNIDGTTGSASDLPGITVSSAEDSATLANDYSGTTFIQGQGSSPSVSVSEDTSTNILNIVEFYANIADQYLEDCSSLDGGDQDESVIAYIDGDCSLSGNFIGYGILVVDGSLTMSGKIIWYGVVFVVGGSSMEFDATGTPAIYGALILGAPTTNLSLSGTADLYYSSEAMQIVQSSLENSDNNRRYISQINWLE